MAEKAGAPISQDGADDGSEDPPPEDPPATPEPEDEDSSATSGIDEEGDAESTGGTTGGEDEDEDEDTGSTGSTGGSETGAEEEALEVCFPGAEEDWEACFPVVESDPYDYPDPIGVNYDAPTRFLDVDALDLTEALAPNFLFSEFSDPAKGRYQVVQPHAVEMLQAVRDEVGALVVTSGYRSPTYNEGVPNAAPNSRHMWGDAFDLVPQEATQQEVINACAAMDAGYIATYDDGHVHCDWRDIDNDEVFFADVTEEPVAQLESAVDGWATITQEGSWLRVDALSDTEGEGPLSRSWAAYDADGELLASSRELEFEPPPGTSTIRVNVGGRVVLTL